MGYRNAHKAGAIHRVEDRQAAVLFLCFWCASLQGACGQTPEIGVSAKQVATDAAAKEVSLIQDGGQYLRYQVHTKDAKGDQIREVIESKDGTVARVLRRENRALTTQEDAGERDRLQEMLDSPDAFRRHVQKDQTGKRLAVDLIKLLPQAMIFSYAPGQPQRVDRPADAPKELVVDFKPDPNWSPPTMISQALTGLEGRCWIDAGTRHMTRLEADLFQGINFGFGFFAHLYPGGTFVVGQVPVGNGRWFPYYFAERATVRAMMVKTLRENTDLVASNFAAVPAMDYRQAIRELLAQPLDGGPRR